MLFAWSFVHAPLGHDVGSVSDVRGKIPESGVHFLQEHDTKKLGQDPKYAMEQETVMLC